MLQAIPGIPPSFGLTKRTGGGLQTTTTLSDYESDEIDEWPDAELEPVLQLFKDSRARSVL